MSEANENRQTSDPIDEDVLWERHSELVETIRCDMRGDETLMSKKQFLAALDEFKRKLSPTKDAHQGVTHE